MAVQPTNKALAVLAVLGELGPLKVGQVAEIVRDRTPCGVCDGTGEGESRWGCSVCYGHGKVPFHYSDAYQALVQLMKRGLVTRAPLLDAFGDETRTFLWTAVETVAVDELEAMFAAPPAEHG